MAEVKLFADRGWATFPSSVKQKIQFATHASVAVEVFGLWRGALTTSQLIMKVNCMNFYLYQSEELQLQCERQLNCI